MLKEKGGYSAQYYEEKGEFDVSKAGTKVIKGLRGRLGGCESRKRRLLEVTLMRPASVQVMKKRPSFRIGKEKK